MVVALVKPRSYGQLRLRSSDPAAVPLINLGYFSDPHDLPRIVEGVHKARQITSTPPLNKWVQYELAPGNLVTDAAEELEVAIEAGVVSYHHPTGTCRMGTVTDVMAVVDAHGSVHGSEGLSVIDASIMLETLAANTNLPTMMLAEHCADWLIETI